jgi:protein-S-isoprenylcysteine O-methyltransferase Ste14
MTSPEVPDRKQPARAGVPLWIARFAALVVFAVGPWVISLFGQRHGWSAGYPALLNLIGLIPVLAGTAVLLWSMELHFAHDVKFQVGQDYLLRHGPYAFTRQPMYLSELVLLFGWAIFYGSIGVLIGFLIALLAFNFVAVPMEERALEARFGEAYRQFKSKVPRWLGKTR